MANTVKAQPKPFPPQSFEKLPKNGQNLTGVSEEAGELEELFSQVISTAASQQQDLVLAGDRMRQTARILRDCVATYQMAEEQLVEAQIQEAQGAPDSSRVSDLESVQVRAAQAMMLAETEAVEAKATWEILRDRVASQQAQAKAQAQAQAANAASEILSARHRRNSLGRTDPPTSPQTSPRLSPRTAGLRGSPPRMASRTSPRRSPRGSPRMLRRSGSTNTSASTFQDTPGFLVRRRRSSQEYSPRPSQIWAFCRNEKILALFPDAQTPTELGSVFRAYPEIWEPIAATEKAAGSQLFSPRQLIQLSDEKFYRWFHDLDSKSENQIKYQFKQFPLLTEIFPVIQAVGAGAVSATTTTPTATQPQAGQTDEPKAEHYTILIKNGEVQEILATADQGELLQHFRREFARYVPIFKWFQDHPGYPDFCSSDRRVSLRQLVNQMPDATLWKHLKNSEDVDAQKHELPQNIRLVECQIFS